MDSDYQEFIASKEIKAIDSGIDILLDECRSCQWCNSFRLGRTASSRGNLMTENELQERAEQLVIMQTKYLMENKYLMRINMSVFDDLVMMVRAAMAQETAFVETISEFEDEKNDH